MLDHLYPPPKSLEKKEKIYSLKTRPTMVKENKKGQYQHIRNREEFPGRWRVTRIELIRVEKIPA